MKIGRNSLQRQIPRINASHIVKSPRKGTLSPEIELTESNYGNERTGKGIRPVLNEGAFLSICLQNFQFRRVACE